jgi:hypothetical protein
METQQNPEIKGGAVVTAVVLLLLLAVAACAPAPQVEGAATDGSQFAHNGEYYLGADPYFPAGGKGSPP